MDGRKERGVHSDLGLAAKEVVHGLSEQLAECIPQRQVHRTDGLHEKAFESSHRSSRTDNGGASTAEQHIEGDACQGVSSAAKRFQTAGETTRGRMRVLALPRSWPHMWRTDAHVRAHTHVHVHVHVHDTTRHTHTARMCSSTRGGIGTRGTSPAPE